ncbi:MAG TPA: bacteriohemerythrin [Bryobacteraceae bacterium]|nr:bacteriohemerythrin [Bryobacteraceae bacterium]
MTTVVTPFMVWKDTWLVGIREVDAQHKRLVSLLNDLHEGMRQGHGREALGAVLGSLVSYTKAHFAAEERLMQQYGYGELGSHKQEHERLTATVLKYQAEFERSNVALSVEVLQFLRGWLQNHILGTDKRYAPFLQSKGVR